MLLTVLALLLTFLPTQAQEDSLQANRYVMRSTLYGIGFTNLLDTYLSPMEYTGPEIRFLRESMRMTKLFDGNVSRQTLFQANAALTENKAGTGSEMFFMANWNFAWHYQFRINENFKVLAGPNIDINGGLIYNLRNSNNPVQVKAYANAGASGTVIYKFRIKKYPFTLRYQLNVPLLGVMSIMRFQKQVGVRTCISLPCITNPPSANSLPWIFPSGKVHYGWAMSTMYSKLSRTI